MGNAYKIINKEGVYFMTFTVIGWVDIFTRKNYRDIVVDSFKYCQQQKGLILYGYVIMSSHVHLIVSTHAEYDLVAAIRDFKKFTSKAIIKSIQEIGESRREWLLNKFSFEAKRVKRGEKYKLWKDGYYAKEILSVQFLRQKLDYIHNNPVEAGIVLNPTC